MRKKYIHQKDVELVLAKIYDINDEDIQKEYMAAFNKVVYLYDELKKIMIKKDSMIIQIYLLIIIKCFNLFESELKFKL